MAPLRRAVLTAAALLAVAAPGALAKPNVTRDMYGDRYCEYLAIKGQPPKLKADVWNTYGLNDCPDAQWKASDPAQLARELEVFGVVLNGPRYWLMDRASIELAPGTGEIRTFSSGLAMRFIAAVKVPVVNGVPSRVPYHETTVVRSNTFTWSRKHPVHELVAPNGRVYVMQAYSTGADPTLSVVSLGKLGKRLDLPKGWRYRTRKLERALSLTTKGKAVVIQDELQNTYQLLRR